MKRATASKGRASSEAVDADDMARKVAKRAPMNSPMGQRKTRSRIAAHGAEGGDSLEGEHAAGAPGTPPMPSLLDAPEMLGSSFSGGGGSLLGGVALTPPRGSGAAALPASAAVDARGSPHRSPGRVSVSTDDEALSQDGRPLNSPLRAADRAHGRGALVHAHHVARHPHVDDDAVVGLGTHSLIASAPPPSHHAAGYAHAAASAAEALSQAEEEAEEAEEEEDLEYDEFDPFLFMKQLPPYGQVVPRPRPPMLPPKSRRAPRVTLVLDLDETLVHCSIEQVPRPDLVFPVEFNGVTYEVFVRKRPGMDAFLRRVSGIFEVVVFTASQQVYAEKLLDRLDPSGKFIHHRLYRDACVEFDGNFLKDLSILGRDLRSTVIVDNSPHAFAYHVDNGIPIESWFDDESDRELAALVPFLEQLPKAGDVRPLVRKQFGLAELIERA